MSVDLAARVRALEIIVTSFMVQSAGQWGNDAADTLDQWQNELMDRHPAEAEALGAVFEGAISRFG